MIDPLRRVILAALAGLLLMGGPAAAQQDGLSARGLLVAAREAVLSADIAGRLTAMPVRAGESFTQGDTLAAFDCRLYEARLAEARGRLASARADLASKQKLRQLGSVGDLEVAVSEGAVRERQGAVDAAAFLVDRCTVTAPWAGRVVERKARPQESVEAGAPLLEVLDDTALEIDVIVPSPWLAWLRPGHSLAFAVDETGTEHAAEVVRLGARVDPVSQSVTVRARLTAPPAGLVAGMSGLARFTPPG